MSETDFFHITIITCWHNKLSNVNPAVSHRSAGRFLHIPSVVAPPCSPCGHADGLNQKNYFHIEDKDSTLFIFQESEME